MPKDMLPDVGAYMNIVAAGIDWLAGTLSYSSFVVSSQVHPRNPDLGTASILAHFAQRERPHIERQCERVQQPSSNMRLEERTLPAGRIVNSRTFRRAYEGLENGRERRQLVVVMTPCLSPSGQVGYVQLQVSRLGDARELADHHKTMRETYPGDWLREYGLPDHVVIITDYEVVLDVFQERWRVRNGNAL